MTDTAYLVLNGESLVSSNTKVFHRSFEGILLPPMFAELQSTQLRWDEMPIAIISVLSVFNMSLLLFIHNKMSSIHVWMPVSTEQSSSGGALCESSVSSAYLWKSQPWAEMTSNRGWEYNMNKTGLRTEPRGTPYTRGLEADTMPSTITDWQWTLR